MEVKSIKCYIMNTDCFSLFPFRVTKLQMDYFYLAKECENLLIFVSTLLFVIFDYLKGRNFGGKKIWRIWRNLIWRMPKNHKFGGNLI